MARRKWCTRSCTTQCVYLSTALRTIPTKTSFFTGSRNLKRRGRY